MEKSKAHRGLCARFNILIDNVIRNWLELVVNEDGVPFPSNSDGLTIARRLALVHADNGLVGA